MATDKFMSISGLDAYKSKSFEEVRYDDYLKAYTTTGKPPQPVPQIPAGERERAAIGLPPLFQPYIPSLSSATTGGLFGSPLGSLIGVAQTKNIAELPVGQELKVHKVDTEQYQSISCMPQYSFFSFEELRVQAYATGNKAPPLSVKMDPFMKSNITPSSTSNATPSAQDPTEILQSQCAQPDFADHSPEELRVYYKLAGREVNSAEIKAYLGISTAPSIVPPPATPAVPAISTAPSVLSHPGSISAPLAPTTPAPQPTGGLFGNSLLTPQQPKPSFTFKF